MRGGGGLASSATLKKRVYSSSIRGSARILSKGFEEKDPYVLECGNSRHRAGNPPLQVAAYAHEAQSTSETLVMERLFKRLKY